MKRFISTIAAAFAAIVMTFAVITPAFAAAASHTLTINSQTGGHTFEAYQVFAGDYSTEGGGKHLSNVTWGSGVDGSALLQALKGDAAIGADFAGCATAADVATVLEGYGNNSASLDAFAAVVGEHLTETHTNSGEPTGTAPNLVYTISNLDDGYYFVKDQDGSLAGQESNAYTKFMLRVLGDETVDAKADFPPFDKKIDAATDTDTENGNNPVSSNNAAIGDKVPYILTSEVPDMDGYDTYWFVVNDTLSKGLTFNDDVTVKIGDDILTRGDDYTVTTAGGEGQETSVRIVFRNFIQYKDQAGDAITITYSATLNEDAVIGAVDGNPNKAQLIYSNDPNYDYKGDEPSDDAPTGKTPEVTVRTYVTGIRIAKVGEDGRNPLTGAKFKIEGTRLNTVLVSGTRYVQDNASGTYYQLKPTTANGEYTYTNKAPTDQTRDAYVDPTGATKFRLDTFTDSPITKAEDVSYEGWVDANGVLVFKGLGAGEYTITELVAPNGYNLLASPITVNIGWQAPTNGSSDCTWSTTTDGAAYDASDGMIHITIKNQAGATLPSTGGIGTTVFYVTGGVLVVGALIAYTVKRRMDAQA